MNINDNNHCSQVDEILNRIDDYESTIHAGQSFISLITWEKSEIVETSKYSIGRRMTTSGKNIISKNEEITPDILIQKHNELGYIVEVKKSLPKDKREWEEVARQIIKYDDELIGWWNFPNETINVQCVVLLIHISRGKDFSDFFIDYLKTHGIKLKNNVSIIEFSRSDERLHYYFLRKGYGNILDTDLEKKLNSGIPIPIEKVVSTYGKQKFFDCEPPVVEYTMTILWQDIFNSMRGGKIDRKQNVFPIEVSIQQLTDELQKLYGSVGNSHRDVEYPQSSWIRSAMDAFVCLGYAIKKDEENYTILFRKISNDLISNFANHKKNPSKEKTIQADQLTLF
jgi:hypothetical protein